MNDITGKTLDELEADGNFGPADNEKGLNDLENKIAKIYGAMVRSFINDLYKECFPEECGDISPKPKHCKRLRRFLRKIDDAILNFW